MILSTKEIDDEPEIELFQSEGVIVVDVKDVKTTSKHKIALYNSNGQSIHWQSLQYGRQTIDLDSSNGGLLFYSILDQNSIIQSGKIFVE